MNQPTYITDYQIKQPEEDALNFSDFYPALAQIIQNSQTPLTLGVFGPWGSGKTSLLQMIRAEIERPKNPHIRAVWFTAWKYDREEALWRAFILRVLDALYPYQETGERWPVEELGVEQRQQVELLDRLQQSIYRPVEWQEMGRLTADWLQLLREGGEGAINVASTFLPIPSLVKSAAKMIIGQKGAESDQLGVVDGLRHEVHHYHREQLASMEQFEDGFQEALQSILGPTGRLVIFIDDLDRCLPEKAVEVLEAMKLFLEVPGTAFVLGMDRAVIERGIETRYGALFQQSGLATSEMPISGDTYLQKIVQIPFYLPPLAIDDLGHFIATLDPQNQLSEMTRQVFACGLYPNPRQVKRALNIFQLLKAVAQAREDRGALETDGIAWPLLAKTVVIQIQYPELYAQWRRYPTLIQQLETKYTSNPADETKIVQGQSTYLGRNLGGDISDPDNGLMTPYLQDRLRYSLLEQMLLYPAPDEDGVGVAQARFAGLNRSQIATYIMLAGIGTMQKPSEEPSKPVNEISSEASSSLNIIPNRNQIDIHINPITGLSR